MNHDSPDADAARIVDAAITSRRAVRAFLPTPVPRATTEHLPVSGFARFVDR